MGFNAESLLYNNDIKNVLHLGADRGGELPQYAEMGVDKVVWIEANPEVYQELLDNLNIMNIDSVESLPYNQLITDQDDVLTEFNLYYNFDAGYLVGNKGMSSILKADPSWWGSGCYRGSIQLNSLTLDTFLERNNLGYNYDLLNMDIQGAELMAIKHGTKLLENVKYINCEVTFYDLQYINAPYYDELRDYFGLFGFTPVHTEMSAPNWGDVIFAKI